MLEQQTTIILAGMTAALLPLLMGWLAPAGEPHPGSHWWYLGSLTVAFGLVLLGLRGSLPIWLGNHVANSSLLISLLLWAQSLRADLGRSWAVHHVALACVLAFGYYSATYEFLNLPSRISLNRMVMGLQALYIAYLAWLLSRVNDSSNARAMMLCYVLLGLGLWSSIPTVVTATLTLDDRGILQKIPGSPALLALMTAIFSSFCYLGTMLERSTRLKAQALSANTLVDENARLDSQLQDEDRKRRLVLAAGSLAHELNQPLTAALTRVQLAEEMIKHRGTDPRELDELLDKAQTSLWRTNEIMNRIRLAARAQDVPLASLDLREVIKTAAELVGSECAELGVELRLTLPAKALWCQGDEVLLSQVLVNLLRNAAQAQREARVKQIDLTAVSEGAQVKLTLQDQGPGIPEVVLARLGEPFTRGRDEGLGLGLAICKAIVQQHGGELKLENLPVGGAQATMRLRSQQKAST
jgi:signal transduction histidine kinase